MTGTPHQTHNRTLGAYLVHLLQALDVNTVFGIPGVHTVEFYRGLPDTRIRHVTPRHEQGAGFMADGYARVSGKPGVCFVITGPGVNNITTAKGQALADSIPLLVISGVNPVASHAQGRGLLHELPDQSGLARNVARTSVTIHQPHDLPAAIADAFFLFATARPGPAHVEIPTDVMAADASGLMAPTQVAAQVHARVAARRSAMAAELASGPAAAELARAAELCARARQPLVIAGGGVRRPDSVAAVRALAARLGAPTILTANARGHFGRCGAEGNDPADAATLDLPLSPSLAGVRRLLGDADLIVGIGTEFGPTDFDLYDKGPVELKAPIIRIDIDAGQLNTNAPATLGIVGDAAAVTRALNDSLEKLARPSGERRQSTAQAFHDTALDARIAQTRMAAHLDLGASGQRHLAFLRHLYTALPDAIVVGDSTQAIYTGNLSLAGIDHAGMSAWFNSSTGYGTLGYALSAALGAKLAAPERPVIGVIGDGGLQFSLGELGAARDHALPVILVVWDNAGYGEIKDYMIRHGIAPEGVDLTPPDFVAIANAYGWSAHTLDVLDALPALLTDAAARQGPTLIHVPEAVAMGA